MSEEFNQTSFLIIGNWLTLTHHLSISSSSIYTIAPASIEIPKLIRFLNLSDLCLPASLLIGLFNKFHFSGLAEFKCSEEGHAL